jgi:hypothetical protein
MASHAILRVGLGNSVSSLKKDSAFRVLCTDRAEGPQEGFERLAQIGAGGTCGSRRLAHALGMARESDEP